MDQFLSALEKDREKRRQVEKLMAVSISRFFRDRNLWKTIEGQILPAILARESQKINIWSAGCASGEEVYSFKILWEESRRNRAPFPELELWATDMNPELLERARAAVYSSSSLKEIPEEWRARYFSTVKGSRWTISDSLKEGIHWKVHNLLRDESPANDFQIIFLRNSLLTYYEDGLLRPALGRVLESLSPGGYLIIGVHEKFPPGFPALLPFFHNPNIFQKTTC